MSAKQFILGLNSFNCKSKISNVNWDNNLNQPLTITEGDQINVRNVFLDTRTQSTNGIIIAEDTEISLDFYFYYINRGGNQQPSPFDVSLNYPGQSAIPQPIQTGMFDFLNPLNYSVGANAGSIAPQLIPPKEINILSLSRASDIATCTLIPTTKSIPLSTQVSIVEIGSNVPPVVSFDATNVTISDITYTGGSTTFQYASSGPDESVVGSAEAPVGICYTNGKLLATASSPNIGNKAPLVESIMYPDFYGGFIPGEPKTELGINENPAAMLPSTNYTAWVDYNNPANAGITKVEAGWIVTAQDTTQQYTGQNLQQSPDTQTEGESYSSVFSSGLYPDLANVVVGDRVEFPGFTGTTQTVTNIVSAPDMEQVQVSVSLDLVNNNPATMTTLSCESPSVAPFPGIGGFIPNDTSSLFVTLNSTQLSFGATNTQSGPDQGAGSPGAEMYTFQGLISDFPNYLDITTSFYSTYTGNTEPPSLCQTNASPSLNEPVTVTAYQSSFNSFDIYPGGNIPEIGGVLTGPVSDFYDRFDTTTATIGNHNNLQSLLLPIAQFGGLNNIPFTVGNCVWGATLDDETILTDQLFNLISADDVNIYLDLNLQIESTYPILNTFTITIPNSSTIAPGSTIINISPDELTYTLSENIVIQGPTTYYLLVNCYGDIVATFLAPPTFFVVNVTTNEATITEQSFTFSGGTCVFTTIGDDATRSDFLPIAVGYGVNISEGEATGTITQIETLNDDVQFSTDIPYLAPPIDYNVQFSTTTGNFYPPNTTMVNYNQTTFQMTMSALASAQICGQFYYNFLPPSLELIIQNSDYIIIDYIATQTIYVQDLIFTFSTATAFLNSVVSSTAYITSPVTAYAITFPTNTTSIPNPDGLIMTFTQDRPTFSNLSNLNNFSIPMNLNSGDGLPYLAYMNLSQADNQGNPTGICDPSKRVPIKKRWKMIIKAGSYSADRLAQIISRNMSRQKNKIQRNYYLNNDLTIAVTPTDGINKEYRGLIQYTEPYNPIPIDVAVAVPDFLLQNFAGYANGAFTQGYPTQLYNPSRFFLSKNPKSYPQNSDIPLTTAKLQNLSPDYESQYLFDDDDQPFLFRPTSYAKPNPLAVTEPTNELTATQETNDLNYQSEIPNPDINPMTEGETFTAYFPSFETTPFTQSGQTTFALYAVNVPGYEVVADDNLYQIQLPSMTGIGTTDDVQFLLNYLVVWTGMDNTIPVPQITTAAYNNDGYFAFNFGYIGAVPVGGSFAGNFNFIFPFQLPLIQITEAWTALRLNLEPAPNPATQVEANVFNNEIYAYQISFKGDATIANTGNLEIQFSLAGQQGDINQRQDYLYSAGMCYNDANLFKWNKMQPNLIAPPNLVDVYFGPFLTDCYSPFFQKQIKDSNVSTGGYDVNGLSSYYAIRPVITQQMEYIIYENTTLVQNGGDIDVSSNYLFAYAPNYEVVCPLIGASEMSLVYNAENNGIFQFNYAHTPLYAKVASGTSSTVVESVGQYPSYVYPFEVDETDTVKLATPAEGVFQADKQSGIILAAMNPPAFWELLGFDISACIANPPSNDVGKPFMTFEEFAVKTTGGFSGSGNNFDTSITMVGDNLQCYAASADTFSLESGVNIGVETSASIAEPYFINKYTQTPIFYEVQNTNTIDAASIPLAPDGAGFWLIEIVGYNSEFITDVDKMEVKAIVNNYFNQGGSFATTNGSDSYSYRHAGQPIQLSNLKIRILNPVSMTEDKTLGPNNSVYLEVTKQIPAPNLPIINTDSNSQVPWSNLNPPPPPKK